MTEYRAIYKCRLCGEEIDYGGAGEILAISITTSLAVFGDAKNVKGGQMIHKHICHKCKDGSFGFSDFIGFRKVEE